MAKWESLKDIDRQDVMDYLPGYIQSKPDKQFRKHPTTFLNNEGWKDEIINTDKAILNSNEYAIVTPSNAEWASVSPK